MEFKKKTIIWEDNNEPPKDYIWVKSDGKAYEFDYKDRKWVESKSISVESGDSGSGSGEGEGFDLNTIINDYIIQSAPPSAQSSIILPDLWCYPDHGRYKELSIEVVVETIVEGDNISIIPFYKESPQKDSDSAYLIADHPGVSHVPAAQIERIVSDVINGETYYSLTHGVI